MFLWSIRWVKIQSPGSGTTGYANERPGRRTANAQGRLPEYKRRTEFLTGNMNHLPAPCSKLLSHPGLPLSALLGLTWLAPCPAVGYVGPGAGFALAGGLWTALVVGIAALTLMILPLRLLLIWWRRKKNRGKARTDRVVVIGLDGLDPGLLARWMEEGRLPGFKKLAEQGVFTPLRTTLPAITPSAWSTFQTGVDASRHQIFDFITRDPRTYQPVLSSARIQPPSRTLKVGPWQIPLGRSQFQNLRRSQPFWKILGDHHIFSSIVRVPITFPAEKFNGLQLAGMCVPDFRGTQGEFTYLTSEPPPGDQPQGRTILLDLVDGRGRVRIPGPPNPLRRDGRILELELSIETDDANGVATLCFGAQKLSLQKKVYTPWVELFFRAAPAIRLRGLCRFYLLDSKPLKLYITPIQIDPAHPSLPLSRPTSYAPYLARRLGPFATLGLAEDTDALNAGVIDEQAFLDQAYQLHSEREAMFFHTLEKTRKGLAACVFDGPDRIQHMFFRTLDPAHPANQGKELASFAEVIPSMYARMDELVSRTLARIEDTRTVLMVISDHGFCSFKRGVNLNAWLHQNGYLSLRPGRNQSEEWLDGVDWNRTRAFALGLTGLFINLRGREAEGIVAPGSELRQLKTELVARLSGLVDEEKGQIAINKAWDTQACFSGPYTDEGPDLLIGYNTGYRAAWSGASGKVTESIFEDNTRRWSGDHCVDPQLVPGVFLCNQKIAAADPALVDLPSSILPLLGVDPPSYMQGRDLFASPTEPDEIR